MRIALINTIRFYGGGEKRVLRGALEFRRRGDEVSVIGQPDSELGRRCAAEGIPFVPVLMRGYTSPPTLGGVRRALARCRAEVAVAYDERSLRIAALAGRLWGGPPLVYYYGLEGAFKNKAYNRYVVAPRIRCCIANAAAIAEELLSFGCIPAERMRVIYDGVDPAPILSADPTGIREELGVPADRPVIVTVARLVAEKAHRVLLDALAGLPPERVYAAWIAGEGPESGVLARRIEELGLGDRVRLLGFRADVPRLLRAADILCHPSRREGAPNAVREGMIAGLAVVATAASGTPELMADGETGLLSPVDDAPALRRNLDRALADPALRSRLGAAAKRHALAEFSEDRCADLWRAALAEVCPRSGRRD